MPRCPEASESAKQADRHLCEAPRRRPRRAWSPYGQGAAGVWRLYLSSATPSFWAANRNFAPTSRSPIGIRRPRPGAASPSTYVLDKGWSEAERHLDGPARFASRRSVSRPIAGGCLRSVTTGGRLSATGCRQPPRRTVESPAPKAAHCRQIGRSSIADLPHPRCLLSSLRLLLIQVYVEHRAPANRTGGISKKLLPHPSANQAREDRWQSRCVVIL